ncbi:MAG TPA: hypothetical protein VEU62_11295 [Bryobacterales bacterium]|nr:hypothetical protein [Bryobacterales bacterium]
MERLSKLMQLYDRYAESLATTWLRRTSNPELTRIIVRRTFERAADLVDELPKGQSALTWLRMTARGKNDAGTPN